MATSTKTKTKTNEAPVQYTVPGTDDVEVVTWSEVDQQVIRACIDAITRLSWALIFGRTSDGGALACTLLLDNDKRRVYWETAEKADVALRRWTEWAIDIEGSR